MKVKGPVPIGLLLLEPALAESTITASPQPMLNKKLPVGVFSLTTTIFLPCASTEVIAEKSAFWALVLFSAVARSNEKTTSLESNAAPSWNFTPRRRLNV